MVYRPRSSWTTAPKSAVRLAGTGRTQTEIYVHWPASGGVIGTSTSRIRDQIRAWHRLHTRDRGWADIAYNLGVDQNGDVWELRGIDRQCGGNGGTVTNRRGQAILAIMGMGETPSAAMIQGIRDAVSRIRREHPQARKILGHRDSFEASTSCPGSKLYALVRSGALEPGAAPSKPAPSTPGLSDGLADVDKSQRWLTQLGYSPGPIDGKYGSQTQAATRAFQTDMGITPADGRPGPATRKDLSDMASKIDTLISKVDALPARVLDAPIALDGIHKGQTSSLRTKAAWEGHNFTQAHQMIAAAQAAVITAVEETARAQGLTDAQVQAIATAAAEASARVSAGDVAGQLTVTTRED